ncbi:tyrosine-type recombinase/integrase [Endozoicomonas euniceicola]|uniref:Tyrosine-type recombinase/integrase n=1 Tax=Endozoicomonas euniceicola TaxID=1234143 RepID=A0ABY6GT63_9GAMM|nr:tyrosine-type recombinase/integrase [Endozoicomonas euniceicola]UYM15953.1 tyrosine-type recombinase/integrase [Endozoicomonas euniceicola]
MLPFSNFTPQGAQGVKPLSVRFFPFYGVTPCTNAGIAYGNEFSSHSLRRGVAHLMVEKGGDIPMLMEHIGWKSEQVAAEYVKDVRSRSADLLVAITGTSDKKEVKKIESD